MAYLRLSVGRSHIPCVPSDAAGSFIHIMGYYINRSIILTLAVGRVRKSVKSCLLFQERWWMQFPTTAFIRIYLYQKTWCWMGISTFLELAFPNSHQLIGKVTYTASVILQWKG